MLANLSLALLLSLSDGTVWHEHAPGKLRLEMGGGLSTFGLSAGERKVMLAFVETWVETFKERFKPVGMDVLVSRSIGNASKVPNGPYFMYVDVMMFWLLGRSSRALSGHPLCLRRRPRKTSTPKPAPGSALHVRCKRCGWDRACFLRFSTGTRTKTAYR